MMKAKWEAHYKTIFNAAVDAILIHDANDDLVEVNQAACDRFGYSYPEMIGLHLHQIIAPEFHQVMNDRLAFLRSHSEMLSFEMTYLTRDGRRFLGEVNARQMDFDGVPAIYSSIRDITQRKHTEQALLESQAALRKSEAQLRSLVHNSPVGISLTDEEGMIIEWNPRATEIYQSPPERTLGRPIWEVRADYLPNDQRNLEATHKLKESLQPFYRTGYAPWLYQFEDRELIWPDGEVRYVQRVRFPIRTERGYMLATIMLDVTDQQRVKLELDSYRHRLENMVEQQTADLQHEIQERQQYEQQLVASISEKEVMLREIHHRVKNNLSVIIALIDLQIAGQKDNRLLQVFKDLKTRVYTMALVHENLFRSPNLARIDFAAYLKSLGPYLYAAYGDAETASGAESGADSAGFGMITAGTMGCENRPLQLSVEAEDVTLRLETAIPAGLLVNELVTNALKFAFPPGFASRDPQGCQIIIRAEDITGLKPGRASAAPERAAGRKAMQASAMPARPIEKSLRLTVKDNGIGFPEALNWHAATSLGMQLVQVLSRQLGGTIEMESNEGVTWSITFTEPG